MYAFRGFPERPGAWPSRIRERESFRPTSASPESTPGTSIISPRPMTPSLPRNPRRSAAERVAPPGSPGAEGTQEGSMRRISRGVREASLMRYSIPGTPATFAISWGSAMTVVVPWLRTARANSEGTRREDSGWTWASTRPGTTRAPPRSWVSAPRYSPVPTTIPPVTAKEVSVQEQSRGLNRVPPWKTASAGSSPRADARSRSMGCHGDVLDGCRPPDVIRDDIQVEAEGPVVQGEGDGVGARAPLEPDREDLPGHLDLPEVLEPEDVHLECRVPGPGAVRDLDPEAAPVVHGRPDGGRGEAARREGKDGEKGSEEEHRFSGGH